jgi:hypothetical protein
MRDGAVSSPFRRASPCAYCVERVSLLCRAGRRPVEAPIGQDSTSAEEDSTLVGVPTSTPLRALRTTEHGLDLVACGNQSIGLSHRELLSGLGLGCVDESADLIAGLPPPRRGWSQLARWCPGVPARVHDIDAREVEREADVLGVSSRTVRRLRWRYERYGYEGLLDHRLRRPSARAIPVAEVQRILQLYRFENMRLKRLLNGELMRRLSTPRKSILDTPATYAYIGASLSGLS